MSRFNIIDKFRLSNKNLRRFIFVGSISFGLILIGSLAALFLDRTVSPDKAKASSFKGNDYFLVDFKDSEDGIVGSNAGIQWRQNISVDTSAGFASLSDPNSPGYFTSVEVRPASFKEWKTLKFQSQNVSTNTSLLASIVECGNTPTQIIAPAFYANGEIDLTNISPVQYPCLRVRFDLLSSNGIAPRVGSFRLDWTTLPVYLTALDCPTQELSGKSITCSLKYSLSYVNDTNTVIYTVLPKKTDNTVTDFTPGYNQNLDMQYLSSNKGGQFTATAITQFGIDIPANSVYWVIPNMTAGATDIVNFSVKVPTGSENGVKYSLKSVVGSAKSDLAVSDSNPTTPVKDPTIITNKSSPSGSITKESLNTIKMNNQNYIYNGAGYGEVVNYSIVGKNLPKEGSESLFDTKIEDDLSGILDTLQASCGIANDRTASKARVNIGSGVWVGDKLTWSNIGVLNPDQSVQKTFSVDYSGCPNGTEFNNKADLSANNLPIVSVNHKAIMGLNINPTGIFAKGDEVAGNLSVAYGVDDNFDKTQLSGEVFSYALVGTNRGLVRLDKVLMTDQIPDQVDLISVSVPDSFKAKVFYSDQAVAPNVDTSLAPNSLGSGWNDYTSNQNLAAKWISIYIPCLNSDQFPAKDSCLNTPSTVTAKLQVKIKPSGNVCTQYNFNNNANFKIFSASNDINNADANVTSLATPVAIADTESTHVGPAKPDLKMNSNFSGPGTILAQQSGDFIFNVSNTGNDTAKNTIVSFVKPSLAVNGTVSKLLVQVSGQNLDVDYISDPDKILVSVGDLPAGKTAQITATAQVPAGVLNGSIFDFVASVSANDSLGCQNFNQNYLVKTTVESKPALQVYKQVKESVVASGDNLGYNLSIINTGNAPSTKTYIVDKIPDETVFKSAITSSVDPEGNQYNCNGCEVWFSEANSNLPFTLSPTRPIDQSIINAYFSKGQEITPGKWQAPTGTKPVFVAFLVDNKNFSPAQFPTNNLVNVGFEVTNDKDGYGPSGGGSSNGTSLNNTAAVFSSELIQAIGNQTTTNVLPDPGLRIYKTSESDFYSAGEIIDWKVKYYNDSIHKHL